MQITLENMEEYPSPINSVTFYSEREPQDFLTYSFAHTLGKQKYLYVFRRFSHKSEARYQNRTKALWLCICCFFDKESTKNPY